MTNQYYAAAHDVKRPETKVLGKEIVTIKGVQIEVRLIEVPILEHFPEKKWTTRILPRCRYFGNTNISNQLLIRNKIAEAEEKKHERRN